jgi:hypothetical protein
MLSWRYPRLILCGFVSGYFGNEGVENVIKCSGLPSAPGIFRGYFCVCIYLMKGMDCNIPGGNSNMMGGKSSSATSSTAISGSLVWSLSFSKKTMIV